MTSHKLHSSISKFSQMNSESQLKNILTLVVNWFNSLDEDKPAINREGGSKDIFSRLMNRISN